jgi:DNA-binding NtrC family response regulator
MNRLYKQIAIGQPTVLLVAAESAERARLQAILQEANCRVLLCARGRDALELVEFASVVICEAPLPDCSWQEILHKTQHRERPPAVIVTSTRTSGTRWAEALNLGAYDVIAQPVLADEALRVVRGAHRQYTLPGGSRAPARPVGMKTHATSHAL